MPWWDISLSILLILYPAFCCREKSHWVGPKERVPADSLWLSLIISQTGGLLPCHKLLEVQMGWILHNGLIPEINKLSSQALEDEGTVSLLADHGKGAIVARADGSPVRPQRAGTVSKVASSLDLSRKNHRISPHMRYPLRLCFSWPLSTLPGLVSSYSIHVPLPCSRLLLAHSLHVLVMWSCLWLFRAQPVLSAFDLQFHFLETKFWLNREEPVLQESLQWSNMKNPFGNQMLSVGAINHFDMDSTRTYSKEVLERSRWWSCKCLGNWDAEKAAEVGLQ